MSLPIHYSMVDAMVVVPVSIVIIQLIIIILHLIQQQVLVALKHRLLVLVQFLEVFFHFDVGVEVQQS